MALLDKVKEVGIKGYDKAKDLGILGKLKLESASIESKIENIYTEIGMKICSDYPEIATREFPGQMSNLLELSQMLEGIVDQMNEIKEENK